MTKKQALKILIEHNAWRRDQSEIPAPFPTTYTAKELGQAIDVAIMVLEECLREKGNHSGDNQVNNACSFSKHKLRILADTADDIGLSWFAEEIRKIEENLETLP